MINRVNEFLFTTLRRRSSICHGYVQRIHTHNEIGANGVSVANKCRIFLFSSQEQNLQDLWIVDRYTTEGG